MAARSMPSLQAAIHEARLRWLAAEAQGELPMGAEWYQSTRTDAGSWTDTTTSRPMIGLILGANAGAAAGAGADALAITREIAESDPLEYQSDDHPRADTCSYCGPGLLGLGFTHTDNRLWVRCVRLHEKDKP